MALELPRVTRQPHLRRGVREHRLPIHPPPSGEKRAEGGEHGPALRLFAPQRRDDMAALCLGRQAFADRTREHRVRRQLKEDAVPAIDEEADRLGEKHWLADVAPPIRRAEIGGLGLASAAVTVEKSGSDGRRASMPSSAWRSSPRMGSM